MVYQKPLKYISQCLLLYLINIVSYYCEIIEWERLRTRVLEKLLPHALCRKGGSTIVRYTTTI